MSTTTMVLTDLESAVAAAEGKFTAANPLSHARHERACAVLPSGHTRQTLYYAPFPLTIRRGRSARVEDLDGHQYLNLVGDFAAGIFGSTCEPLQQAVHQAMGNGISLSGPNLPEVEFAELITQR